LLHQHHCQQQQQLSRKHILLLRLLVLMVELLLLLDPPARLMLHPKLQQLPGGVGTPTHLGPILVHTIPITPTTTSSSSSIGSTIAGAHQWGPPWVTSIWLQEQQQQHQGEGLA